MTDAIKPESGEAAGELVPCGGCGRSSRYCHPGDTPEGEA